MKQIWPNYSYSPTTNVLTLTGLNIDRDQLLLVTAADRGRIIYNFADSSVTASAFTSGANTALTLVATTAGLTTTAALVIYYDDQLASTTVTVSSLPAISGTVTANLGNVAGIPLDNPPSHAVRIGWGSEDVLRSAGVDAGGEPLPIQIHLGNSSDDRVTTANPLPISGTVTASNISSLPDTNGNPVVRSFVFGYDYGNELPVAVGIDNQSLLVTINSAIPSGTSQIGSVTAS